MKSGDFVFFLDGYDEISSNKKEKITKEIDNLVKLYSKNQYLLTSRPYTEIDLLPLFHNFEVCKLSDDDISQFIKKQIPSEESELIDKIIEAINSPENRAYKSFLSNPLLLSMFILTFQSYSSIPPQRSAFYSQVFDALFAVHDSMSKLAFVREKQSGLSKEKIIEVLELFSFMSYFEQKFIFTSIYLNEKLDAIKSKKIDIDFINNKLISDLQIAIGIINKEGTEYTFPHRSLQEYFSARYISSLTDSNKKVVYLKIIKSLTSQRSFRMNSSDNFHLLLSELDENGVIEFALIPYFKSYVSDLDFEKVEWKGIVDLFLDLEAIYESFYSILKTNDLKEQNQEFSKIYDDYNKGKGKKLKGKAQEKRRELARKRLALEEIKPFLESYKSKLIEKGIELEKYLEDQEKSDSDIIALI